MICVRLALAPAILLLLVRAAPADELPEATDGILAPGVADKLLPPGSSFVVKVLDAGSAPREELRYDLAKGSVVELTEQMETEGSVSMGQAPAKQGKTPMTRQVVIRTKDSGPRGAHVEIEVIHTRVPGSSDLSGKVEADVDPKGRLTGMQGAPPGPTGFQSSIVVLPDGPLGRGARWRLVRLVSTNKDLLSIDTYTLRSRHGRTLELDVASAQFVVRAKMKLPNGSDATVRRYQFRGSGHQTVVTDAVVPSATEETSRHVMELSANGIDMKLDSVTTTKTSAHAVLDSR
jgi:hypothetical protein